MEQQRTSSQASDVTHRFSHDNLHIALDTHFDPPQADALISLLHGNQARCKRIFIDVRRVSHPHPLAVSALKTELRLQGLGSGRVIFKGQCGFDLAVNGNRVLLLKERPGHAGGHVCKGNCAHCKCGRHRAEKDA